ncbi:MAG: 2-amino-4-hydroxy-6-hydroxymethyldihydropteridine diphosphokinase [Acidaminococcaceae bacterium]|nr:2-amino-4-hydroxy-6-hydroxymethyldihydropteridine diphosphokinase [Acidaminococcaceae bacterium]
MAGKNLAYIALGSNLGDKKANLLQALELMKAKGIEVKRVSSFRVTAPYGVTDQPDFLNAVCEVVSCFAPEELLALLLDIESSMGRVRLRHWGERNIDLDLLLYGDLCLHSDTLILPHPELQNRDFVMEPLCELAPSLKHPILGKTMEQLRKELLACNEKKS